MGTYWVDDNGAASWVNAESDTPLSGASAASLSTANANAAAGDVVNLREGSYTTGIIPSASGSSGNVITFQAHTGETPSISTAASISIDINGQDYIKVDGMTVVDSRHWVFIQGGSNYNEIANGTFHGKSVDIGDKGFMLREIGGPYNTHNWIHDCTMYDSGFIDSCNDAGGVISFGGAGGDFQSNYNTLEDNVFYFGGHHILETFTEHNVIRNNVFRNNNFMADPGGCPFPAGDDGKYGNRNIQIYDGDGRAGVFNLVEGNRIGHAGDPPDDNGAHNLVITSPQNIIRYNDIYNAGSDGLYFKQGAGADSENNRAYNNTIYHNGYGPAGRTGYRRDGVTLANGSANNIIKNNIIYDSSDDDCNSLVVGHDCTTVNTFTNNWVTTDGDPSFVDPDVSDPTSITKPNLTLQSSSGAINNGTFLTQANGAGSGSTTLIVDDALFFQDGTWGSSLSNIQPDHIAIGTVEDTVQISSINYDTNTITLASAMTWSNTDSIWLYRDSSGRRVLFGVAPDQGAHEYGGAKRAQTDATIGVTGYWVQASVKTGNTNTVDEAGVFARASDVDNNYYAFVAGDGNVYLFAANGQLASATISGFSASTYYSLRLECSGAQIRVLVDDTEKISVTNTEHITAGSAGLYIQDSNARITSFRLRQIASVTESATVANSVSSGVASGISANETIAIVDSPNIGSVLGVSVISESITVIDSPSITSGTGLFISESITVADSPSIASVFGLSVSEGITIADVPFLDGLVANLFINEFESITVADSPSILSVFAVSANESVAIVDSPSIGSVLGISASEVVAIADSPLSGIALQPTTVAEALVFVDVGTGQLTIENIDTLFTADARTSVFESELKTTIFTSET